MLPAWNENLQASWPQLSARYPETTRLMFEYFIFTVAAAFRAGELTVEFDDGDDHDLDDRARRSTAAG